jgi:hypothetical protein
MYEKFEPHVETPSVMECCRLRATAGLTPSSEVGAAAGLPLTDFKQANRAVGMGRVMGDGLFNQPVNRAVSRSLTKGIG